MEQPNLDYILQLSAGSEEFKQKIISIVKLELPQEIEVYNQYMQNNHYLRAAESVHKLKHKISVLGLEKSYYIAEQFEENLKNNQTNLQVNFEAILHSMQDFVNKL
jgi:HPt (histidine-containing phosphotransfer) domain-containing protein